MKIFKKLTLLLLVVMMVFSAVACEGATSYYFELDAFTENSDSGEYDSSLFYRNDLGILGADASSLYVPEGRHLDENGVDLYGGYYYMYPSAINITGWQGLIAETQTDADGVKYKATNPVYRSKDLNNWELCGAVDGTFSTRVEMDDWAETGILAPDIFYDEETGKYFIYEQTNSKTYDDDPSLYTECPTYAEVTKHGENYKWWDRFFIGIYVSDTPVGPFKVATSENVYGDANQPNLNGKVVTRYNPPINIKRDLGLDVPWGVIDAHPFRDSDGQLYLYFCHHVDSSHDGVDIWGMKMKDVLTPDYESMTFLIKGGYTTITKNEKWADAPWDESSYDLGEPYELENGAHGNGNEGPFMMTKDYVNDQGEKVRRYLLIYSGGGYNNKHYDMMQTISETGPLGPFVKPKQYASSISGTSYDNDWVMGAGHGSILSSPSGDEMFILGWGHADTSYDAATYGRWYSVEKVHWVNTPEYGWLLYGNGPTKSLQPKMYDVLGLKNIAPDAKITVASSGYEGIEYLNDQLFVSHDYYGDWEFSTKGKTIITLTFDEPRSVNSVLVYNSYKYEYAFSGLEYIEFELAEKPLWYTGSNYVPTARVSDIEFSKDFLGTAYDFVRSGSACLAAFDEIKVKSVKISVSEKLTSVTDEIRISDIVVLGK